MIAFGYIRIVDDDERAIEALHDLITRVGAREGFALKEIYVDRYMPDDALIRPGFQALTSELLHEEGAKVLVTTLDHLSPLPTVLVALQTEVLALGAHIVTLGSGYGQFDHVT